MSIKGTFLYVTIITTFIIIFSGCANTKSEKVVIYTSVDQVFSEPILDAFEKQTGIDVLPVYDVEAAKTVGLSNRLIAESKNPKADVFWNGEFCQTILLKEKGILQSYKPSDFGDIDEQYFDEDYYWTGFGGRARVLLVNKRLIKPSDYPKSILDLTAYKYSAEKIGIANPVFGTTSTHSAALYAQWGANKGKSFFQQLKNRGVSVVDGNSVVRDMVVDGRLIMGMTDTDDALSAIEKGAAVEVVPLDQEENGIGTLITPNTVAMIKGGPNPENARKLIDYLTSKSVEDKLIDAGWIDMSLRKGANVKSKFTIKGLNVGLKEIYNWLDLSKKEMQEIFVK